MSGSTWFPASEKPAPAPPATNGLLEERDYARHMKAIIERNEARDERDAAIRERDRIRENAKAEHNIAKAALDERDTAIRERNEWHKSCHYAIRERDKLRGEITSVLDRSEFASKELTRLRARVASLESQLESVADRAAAAETALESAPAASVVPDVVRDMTEILRSPTNDPDAKHEALATLVEAVCPGWRMAPAASNSSAILTSSPAASGAAGTEPVAWCVMSSADTPHRVGLHWDQRSADRWARVKQSEYTTKLVVVPLYDRPQAASGAAGNSPAVPVSSGLEAAGTELPTE